MKLYEGNEPYLFVSYAHKDSDRVLPILEALSSHGFRLGYDAGGEADGEWPSNIEEHLKAATAVLVFASAAWHEGGYGKLWIENAVARHTAILVVYVDAVPSEGVQALPFVPRRILRRERYVDGESFIAELAEACLPPSDAKDAAANRNRLAVRREGRHRRAVAQEIAPLLPNQAPYASAAAITEGADGLAQWLRPSAASGDADRYVLTNCREDGAASEETEAARRCRMAAIEGDCSAQYELATCYLMGVGVPSDFAEAIVWLQRAAEAGHAEAQVTLARCYARGNGVERNDAEAVGWYRRAAEQGDADAEAALGFCYYHGHGVAQSYSEAVTWYRRAAERGCLTAQYNLALCYDYGLGVVQSQVEAVDWCRRAAEQGHAKSQDMLGECYELGLGVTQNESEAVIWYHKAAEQGHRAAQYRMGECCRRGRGVAKNKETAILWYRRAAKRGHRDAKAALRRLGVSETE